jgi:hypothetical protein
MITKKCLSCGNVFTRPLNKFRVQNYCSRRCYDIHAGLRKKSKILYCIKCNTQLTLYKTKKTNYCIKCKEGHPHTIKSKLKLSECHKNIKNPMWKGENVGYSALHQWVKRYFSKTIKCNNCKKVPPYDLANKGIYNRDFKNWEWLCRRCHMTKDGRMKNLVHRGKIKTKNKESKNAIS